MIVISSATVLEAGIVLETRRGEQAGLELDLFLHRAKFEVVSVDAEQVEIQIELRARRLE